MGPSRTTLKRLCVPFCKCLRSIPHSLPLPKQLPPTLPAHFAHIPHTLPVHSPLTSRTLATHYQGTSHTLPAHLPPTPNTLPHTFSFISALISKCAQTQRREGSIVTSKSRFHGDLETSALYIIYIYIYIYILFLSQNIMKTPQVPY